MYFENPNIEVFLHESQVIVFDLNGLIIDDEAILAPCQDAWLALGTSAKS